MTAPSGGGPSRSSGASAGVRGAVVVGLAVILGIVGLQILDESGPSGSASLTTSTVPGATSGSSATTTPLHKPAEVRVKVYNASGVQGTAETMTDKLHAEGYNMQTPANLSDERAGTVVQCIEGFERGGHAARRVRRRRRCHHPAVPEGSSRGRVRRRLHRRHRHGLIRAGGTVALPPALRPFVAQPERAALFVDFDGSVSPIVPDPPAARPLPAARAALARLVPVLGTVVVVSGRPAAFLAEHLGIDGLGYVGAYGLERFTDGRVVVDDRVRPWVDTIARAADDADAALPGLLVERKGEVAVTIHWRGRPDRGAEATAWAEATATRLGLHAPIRGRMAIELRPPLPVDKGTTIAALGARRADRRLRGRRRR